jgi:hypothetical protein
MSLAPIALFVYNRLDHTKQTITALQKNELAGKSELFIYSDASNNKNTTSEVKGVREYLRTIDGFKNITIVERKNNWGLAKSIINGVTSIVNEYGKIIVLEDDIVTSPYFLKFMNEALDFYKDEGKVWHISGWNYPLNIKTKENLFFWNTMNCWGWATWQDRWKHFNKDPEKLINNWSPEQIHSFDLKNSGVFWKQVEDNYFKKIDTWAIFWYSAIFENKGLCLNPCDSLVQNIGLDGSGTNCGNNNDFDSNLNFLNLNNFIFPDKPVISIFATNRIVKYYKKRKYFFAKVKRKLKIILNSWKIHK